MWTGTRLVAMVGMSVTAGCGANGMAAHRSDTPLSVYRAGSGIVIEGADVGDNDRTVLTILRRNVPGLSVTSTTYCPVITMRGRDSIHSPPDPAVYVNDSRSTNTCVLDELQMNDVARVEVYPNGVGPNPSYGANAGGLILVFTRRTEP